MWRKIQQNQKFRKKAGNEQVIRAQMWKYIFSSVHPSRLSHRGNVSRLALWISNLDRRCLFLKSKCCDLFRILLSYICQIVKWCASDSAALVCITAKYLHSVKIQIFWCVLSSARSKTLMREALLPDNRRALCVLLSRDARQAAMCHYQHTGHTSTGQGFWIQSRSESRNFLRSQCLRRCK